MKRCHTVSDVRAHLRTLTGSGRRIALVPTMGALHDGHLRLVEDAAGRADHVLVSVFVNPTQFGPGEDYEAYPRTLEEDCRRLEAQGLAGSVFAPTVEEMYGTSDPKTWVVVDRLTDRLCGASRPGHFKGVTTIVAKLLIVCRPDVAVFGLKDAQQYFIVRALAGELHLESEIVGVPTVREADGVALSSRNRYLTTDERKQAVVMYRAVTKAKEMIQAGETAGNVIRQAMRGELVKADLGSVDYADLVSAEDFYSIDRVPEAGTIVAAVAVQFGRARLIDNVIVER